MCRRKRGRPVEGGETGQFSRDGTTADLMKMLSEVIVAVAFEPSGKITWSTKRNEFSLRSQGKKSSKWRFYSPQRKREKKKEPERKKYFAFFCLEVWRMKPTVRKRVTGWRGWTQEGTQTGRYLEWSHSNFLHECEYSTGPSITVTASSERHLSLLLLSPPPSQPPPPLKSRCIMCD